MADFDREGARAAGYSDAEIDSHLAEEAKPRVSQGLIDRINNTNTAHDIFKSMWEGAKEGFGSSPLGIEPGSQMENFFKDAGWLSDPATGRVGPLRTFNEAILRPSAVLADTVMRTTNAGIFAGAGLVGQAAKDAGASDADANRLKRDMVIVGQIAPLLRGTAEPMHRVTRGPMGELIDEPVGGLPNTDDFRAAHKAATEGQENAHVLTRLEAMYEKQGITPGEAVADAARDPIAKQDLLMEEPLSAAGGEREQFKQNLERIEGNLKKLTDAAETRQLSDEEIMQVMNLTRSRDAMKRMLGEVGPGEVGPGKDGGGGKPPGPPEDTSVGPPEPRNPKASDGVKAAEDKVLSQLSVGEPDRPRTKMDPYTAAVDSLFPLKKEVEKARGKGLDVPVTDDPYIAARLYGGWVGKAQVALEHEGPFNFFTYENAGPSLKTILGPVREQLSSWRAFLASSRAVELEKLKGKPSGIDMEAARTVGKAAPKAYKDQATALYEYQNQLTEYLRDSGVLNRNGFKNMLEGNKFYVPWHKLLDEEGIGISPIGTSMQAKNPIKRIEGHTEKTIDPLESVIKNTYILTAMAEKNVVATKLVDMMLDAEKMRGELKLSERAIVKSEISQGGEIDRPVYDFLRRSGVEHPSPDIVDFAKEAAAPVGEDEIRVFRNGQPERYKVPIEVARAFKGLDRGDIGFLEQLLSPLARTLRAGAVLSPEFAARHLIRDTTYAFMTWGKEGNFTPVDTVRGLTALWAEGKNPDFVNWLKGGGGQVSLVAMDRRYLQESLRDLTAETGLMTRAWNVMRHPLSPLQTLTEMATSATHMGAFSKRMRQLEKEGRIPEGFGPDRQVGPAYDAPRLGKFNTDDLPALRNTDMRIREELSTKEGLKSFGYDPERGEFTEILSKDQASKKAIIDAAWTSRETSVDMHRMGAKMRGVNLVSVFANAKIQDTFRIVDLIKENPTNAALMISAGIVAPSVLFWALNHKDSRYKELPAWQKDSFWIVPTDKWENATPEQAGNRPPDQIRMFGGQLQVNNGAIHRIPKPFNAGVLFGSGMERLLEKFASENPHAFDGWLHSVLENTTGDLVPTAVVPLIEQATNQSRLSGRKVIPGNLEGQMPEYQYTPYTTEVAKKLGMLASAFPGMHKMEQSEIGAFKGAARALSSPMLVENYVRGWTGTLGVYALHAADVGLQKAGILPSPVKPLATLADMPFIRAFTVRYPTAGVESVERFFSAVADNKVLHDTFMRRAAQGDVNAMQRIQDIGGPQMFERLDQYKHAITIHTDLINKVYENPKIPPAEKRQLIDGYYFAMIRMGQVGSDLVDNIDKGLRK